MVCGTMPGMTTDPNGEAAEVTNLEFGHAMLVALLMELGGSYELPLSAFATDAMGHVDGSAYSVEVRPIDQDHVRLAVVSRAEHARPQPS
jgi:hypothetical protein